jgi:membrane associated rhomboid family serine protease
LRFDYETNPDKMSEYPITVILLVANVVFSYFGFQRAGWMDKYMFWVEKILIRKEYVRMVSSGFLHVDLVHIVMNMVSLYYMGRMLEVYYAYSYGSLGGVVYLVVYFGSLLGGNALALLLHRNHGDYTAAGASGALSGVMFALVVLAPYEWIRLFGLIPLQYWWYAVLYVIYSLFGIRTQFVRLGHEAHLGGALIGLALGCVFAWRAALEHWVLVVGLTVPTTLLIYLFYHNPVLGLKPLAALQNLDWGFTRKRKKPTTHVNTRNQVVEKRVKQDGLEINMKSKLQQEMDALLDKVAKKGIHGLTMHERARLDELGAYLGKSDDLSGGRAPKD